MELETGPYFGLLLFNSGDDQDKYCNDWLFSRYAVINDGYRHWGPLGFI
jgi:hypothetical protein